MSSGGFGTFSKNIWQFKNNVVYLQYILKTINMIKEKDILIRINQELKQKVKDKAKSLGLSVSSYIRLLLIKELENE